MFQKITRPHLEHFLKPYASESEVLDVGSGGSSYSRYFPNRLTVDIDPARQPEIVADAHALPFAPESFELVLCTEVLEHVKNPSQVISELNRVLKPGGMLLLTTRFVYPIHDAPHDYWRFTRYGMLELFKAWEVIELRGETATFSVIAALIQRICFQSQLRFNKVTKLFLFMLAALVNKLNFLTVKEYGDIKKETSVDGLMTTGYYIAARKKS
jgi:ubiquinone/menaquinone biosynthesis C-methylase UbiE